MFRPIVQLIAFCVLALVVPVGAAQEAPDADQEPRRTELVETAERRLVQVDVTVRGSRDAITGLQGEDFELAVGLKKVNEFIVDDLCVLPEQAAKKKVEVLVEESVDTEPVAEVPARLRTNFLFYFDQHHLTMAGRARAIDVAQELIPELVVEGNRGMIVSAGKQLETFSELSDDLAQLAQAMRDLNGDHSQWDPWVQQEESRIDEIVEILNDPSDNVAHALSVARGHQREERWRTQKALHLFSMVIGRMAELDPPKVVVYFADTMRSNAGEHYLSFFSRRVEGGEGDISNYQAFDAAHAFDRVVEEATALGIRVYTIEARGLMSAPNRGISSETAAGSSSPVANSQPVRDAQDSLTGLALESGGRAFLNGVRARKIAAEIEKDLSCVYLLSFDVSHLRENSAHRVVVRVDRPGVKVHARGQIMVQSESRRLTSRLMAAFASPKGSRSESSVDGVVIPTGYEDGKYSALVQIHVPGSLLPATSWDLGLSLISRGEVEADASGRVSVSGPGVPVVLESQMRFRPGPFRLVGVAHDTAADAVSTAEIEADWPDPDGAAVTVGPVAVLQPEAAAILREENLRQQGAVGISENGILRTDRPTALIGIVCRARGNKGKLRVERKLVGDADSFAPFGPLDLDLREDRCAQIRDGIPAGSMSSGMFTYEVRVFDKDDEVAFMSRKLAAVDPEENPEVAEAGSP